MGSHFLILFNFCPFSFHTNKQIFLLYYCCLWDWSKSGSHFICSAQFFPLFFIFFFFFIWTFFLICLLHFCYLCDGNKPGSAPAKFISCVSANATLYFWQKQIFIFSNTVRSFDHQMSAFVIDIYMCPACNAHSKSTKREVHLCPLRLGQNGILETIWLLCKYAKITRWPRQNIFKKKDPQFYQFQKCLLRGNQKMPPWRDWPSWKCS